TARYVGLVAGDTPASLTGTLSCITSATTASSVGSYPVTPGGQTSANYSIQYYDGTLDITKAHLTMAADNKTKVYDGLVFSPFTVTLSGFVNGDTYANLCSSGCLNGAAAFIGSAVTATDVGSYTITPMVGSIAALNYDITSCVNGALTITPA